MLIVAPLAPHKFMASPSSPTSTLVERDTGEKLKNAKWGDVRSPTTATSPGYGYTSYDPRRVFGSDAGSDVVLVVAEEGETSGEANRLKSLTQLMGEVVQRRAATYMTGRVKFQ